MFSYIGKSSQLAPALKGSVQAVASGSKNVVISSVPISEKKLVISPASLTLTTSALYKRCPTRPLHVKSGIAASTQIRYAHTDLEVPDFSAYRRSGVKSPQVKAGESSSPRQSFTYIIVGSGVVLGGYSAKTIVSQFIGSMSATADVLALAKIEIKLDDIPEGKNMTFKWRGKPLFIRHRTDDEISTEQQVDLSSLRDPQHDNERTTDPKWLIVIGVCTHLGCVPIANAGDFGGYYCPCHGSHYDGAGRIRKGPAPLNLEIPHYEFPGDGTIVVG